MSLFVEYLCARLSVRLFLLCKLWIDPFPLTLKVHKLKLMIENALNGNMSQWGNTKTSHAVQYSNYDRKRWHFRGKKVHLATVQWKHAFTDPMMYAMSMYVHAEVRESCFRKLWEIFGTSLSEVWRKETCKSSNGLKMVSPAFCSRNKSAKISNIRRRASRKDTFLLGSSITRCKVSRLTIVRYGHFKDVAQVRDE